MSNDGPPDKLKVRMNFPPKLENLHPPPKLLKTATISASVHQSFKDYIIEEAYKRSMTQTNLLLAALDMYLNPHTNYFIEKGHRDMGILPINRAPKGEGATPKHQGHFKILIASFKQDIAQARTKNISIQQALLKKKVDIKYHDLDIIPTIDELKQKKVLGEVKDG